MEIEAGKRYVRRDGQVSGVISTNDHSVYAFRDADRGLTYTHKGFMYGKDGRHHSDLVTPYIEPSDSNEQPVSSSEVSGKESTVQYDLSGIPAGYEFVGYRLVKAGDMCVSRQDYRDVFTATLYDERCEMVRVIVCPISPPEPKQRTVAIHKWLVADKRGESRIVFGTAAWVESCKFSKVVDLGLYEEVKVDV